MNFVFYDLETTGRNATWDQILQIGAILVDSNFQEIDRFEERCRLRQGLIPEPGALIVNKTSVEMLNNVNLSHYQLIKKVYDIFNKWSPAIFIGYNTISFDEEFLRKTFFKLLLEPYTTQFNGNRRADVLGMSRTSKYYYPECINVGLNEKGNQVFKLDVLTQLNDIKHNAHDAMGDVEATIKIAQILKNKAQNVWQSGLSNSNTIEVDNFLLKNDVICMDEYFFGKFNSYAVTYVCKNKFNYPQCFDLIHDPIDYFEMSIKDLKTKMKLKPKFIKEIKNNKNPLLMDESYIEKIPSYKSLGLNVLKERAELIKNNIDFKNKKWSGTYTGEWEGIIPELQRRYKQTQSYGIRRWIESFMSTRKCDACIGKRLKESSMHVKIDTENIGELCSRNIEDALQFFENFNIIIHKTYGAHPKGGYDE